MNSKNISITLVSFLSFALTAVAVNAADRINYKDGFYTNLYGSGTDANLYKGEANCDPEKGFCDGEDKYYLVKFTCDGKKDKCEEHDTESEWIKGKYYINEKYDSYERTYDKSHSITPDCDQTVQIDAFKKRCRVGDDGWECKDDDLVGYMVWYKTCKETPVVPEKKAPVCVIESDKTAGNAPLTVNFDASKSSDPDGSISSYTWKFNSDVLIDGSKITKTFNNVGSYTIELFVNDNEGLKSEICSVNVKANEIKKDEHENEDDNDDDDDGDDNNDDDDDNKHVTTIAMPKTGSSNSLFSIIPFMLLIVLYIIKPFFSKN